MRILRGLGSLLALLIGLIGIPIVLIVIAATLLPDSVSLAAALGALLRPDDGSVVLRLLLVVAAVAWLVFAVSAVAEIIGFVSGYKVSIKLPGLGGPQRLIAGLLLGVVAMVSLPHAPAQAAATPQHAPVAPAQARTQAPAPTVAPGDESAGDAGTHDVRHRVELGDDLWSLAEHYYGNGREWRRIATANPAQLTGGPDRLQVGWQLLIPDAPSRAAPPQSDRVVVVSGDTLSSIAERVLGDESRWQELYDANRAQLGDPDELRIGMSLLLPDTEQQTPRRSAERAPAESPDDAQDRATQNPEQKAAAEKAAAEKAAAERAAADEQTPPTISADEQTPPTVSADEHERVVGKPTSGEGGAASPVPRTPPGSTQVAQPVPPQAETVSAADADVDWPLAAALAGVGGLLAAAFTGGLMARRRLQLQARPLGRRIPQPSAEAQRVEATMGRRARPLTVRSLDLALRAVSAQAFRTGAAPPRLRYVRVADDAITLQLDEPGGLPPHGFTVDGTRWILDRGGVPALRAVAGLAEAPRPYPALVTLGVEESGATVMLDLEAVGLIGLVTADTDAAAGSLLALATELAFAPAADDMFLTLVGGSDALAEALGKHNVTCTRDVDGLLHRLEARGSEQRRVAPVGPARYRIDPDLADPWAPEVVLIADDLSADQSRRLAALITAEPPITLAAVLVNPTVSCEATLRIEPGVAVLEPAGIQLRAQQVGPAATPALLELVQVSGQEETTVAPWWSGEPPDPPPDSAAPSNVAYLSRRAETWAAHSTNSTREEVAQMIADVESGATPAHPVLRLLGPVELDGTAGVLPPRAAKQCLEYCGWLLEHPGSTAPQMTAALAVAEGTRRSNMSRLRAWLGSNAAGEPYLPDAYTGRISLDQAVSSDWHWLQIFTAGGVVRAGDDALHAALGLVRGAPLADAAPGQWHWAEELRTDMISAVRDIGVELARRSLADGDIDGARWAASRALLASPGDELLMVARIRTEHRAGNRAEVERLTLQVAAQARQLGIDLAEETVVVLQEVMEGRARARLA